MKLNLMTYNGMHELFKYENCGETIRPHLCHSDYIRDDTVPFESPEVASSARNPRLNFVGDAQATSFPYHIVGRRQVSWC